MKKHLFMKLKKDLQKGGWNFKSVVALVIFGAIVVVFIFFGYSGKHNRIGTGAAAQVNATLISVADLRSESSRLDRMYAPMFGGQTQGETQRQFIQQQALENLISTELLAQGATSMGILSTDAEVRTLITQDIPAFQENGKFSRERYEAVLEANRWTAGEFEEKMRKERRTQRLRMALEQVATPLNIEVQKNKEMRETKREVDFVRMERAEVIEKMPVSEAEIKTQMAKADFAKKVQDEFNKNKQQYGSEEQVKAQHILIKATPGDEKSQSAALEKIVQIKKRAEKEDFGKLAAQVSEDQGSKINKGDLGTFGRGKMLPEFEAAAFSQKVGIVGEPVKTSFGYHLIKVSDHKAAVEPSFDAVSGKIAHKMIADEKYESIVKAMEADLAKGETAGIEKQLKELGVSWQDSGFFEMSADVAPKLGSPVATELATEVSAKQVWPKKFARDGGALYLVKWKADKKEPLPAGEKIQDTLTKERSYDLLNQWLEQEKKTASIERNLDLIYNKGGGGNNSGPLDQ